MTNNLTQQQTPYIRYGNAELELEGLRDFIVPTDGEIFWNDYSDVFKLMASNTQMKKLGFETNIDKIKSWVINNLSNDIMEEMELGEPSDVAYGFYGLKLIFMGAFSPAGGTNCECLIGSYEGNSDDKIVINNWEDGKSVWEKNDIMLKTKIGEKIISDEILDEFFGSYIEENEFSELFSEFNI